MEYKKKKMSYEEIKDLETKKMDEIKAITDEYASKFTDIGYNLVCKLMVLQSTDSDFHELDIESFRDYSPEYVSQYRITVEKPYSEQDYENLEKIKEENASFIDESEEDKEYVQEQEENDQTSQSKAKAFVDYFLLRTYKSFFIEYVSVPDNNTDEIKADLDEFYNHFVADTNESVENND